jgi:hypothetical protein
VLTIFNRHSASSVVVTGDPLGPPYSSSVYLPLHLPAGTHVRTISYGLQRVGNADTKHRDSLTHINNKKEPVPIVPGKFLGYALSALGRGSRVRARDNPSCFGALRRRRSARGGAGQTLGS